VIAATVPDGTLCDYLSAAAERCPSAIAIRFKDRSVRYRELDELSAALASTLAGAGVGPGDRVAIWLNKSIEAVVAIHGVLKLGAAYVPIDPISPLRRAAYILGDCRVRALVTTQDRYALVGATLRVPSLSLSILADGQVVPSPARPGSCLGWSEMAAVSRPDAGRPTGPQPDDLAYILYTSGSTGTPKGVMLSHRNGRVFVDWAVRRFRLTGDDRLASHAPFHFDLSTFDIFAAAAAGAGLVLVPENRQGLGQALNRFVIDENISVWYSVPSALVRMLIAANRSVLAASNLRVVLFAGEVFPIKHLRQLRHAVSGAELYNLYGPTETNVCTFHQVGDDDVAPERTQPTPIGQDCSYAATFLIDESGTPIDGRTDVEGELCISGDSVMLGYWGDPGRTGQRLIPVPDGGPSAALAYRSGDIVRRDATGDLVFVGRRDHMVKIRGHRIELGEIETVLLGHADVLDGVVVAVPEADGSLRLEGCLVPRPAGKLTEPDLRRHCLESLPRYMLPERFHIVESLPLTSTGKIDRQALTVSIEASAGSRP